MTNTTDKKTSKLIEQMFNAGAHFGYSKTRRHPSIKKFIFGSKNRIEIFDLEKTVISLENIKEYVKVLSAGGKQILFVSSKSEAKEAIIEGASSIGMPFVAGRWIGGTLTNAGQIKKRVDRFQKLESDKEKGLLGKYTKKERLLIDREIDKLERKFSGLVSLQGLPTALFVVDPSKEEIAVSEAISKNIPIIALANSDCNIKNVKYPVAANDSSKASIQFFMSEIVSAYNEGKNLTPKKVVETNKVETEKK
ncbi:30S ribosomal protein S2 [Patescibacteria group bacterium]|nr:30S ribosomal protein S2 [Patescibacteria group bacterium]